MKAQFDGTSMRIRLLRDEFERLRAGDTLRLSLANALQVDWSIELRRGRAFDAQAGTGGIELNVPGAELDALASRLPSRTGIETRIDTSAGTFDFSIEVDVRDRN